MSVIASTLVEASPPTYKERAKGLLARVNKLRLLGLLAEGGAALMGMPTFGATAKAVEAGGRLLEGKEVDADGQAVSDAVAELKGKASGMLGPAVTKEPPEEIGAFRKEFGEVLEGLDRTLVVFIDNLDRCLPANAIQTLEAIRLFLFLPRTAFVIAADEDMVRHAVAQHFHNPGERHVTDYLDKLIQMPVYVPRAGVLEIRAYLVMLQAVQAGVAPDKLDLLRSRLIGQLQRSWTEDPLLTTDEILAIVERAGDSELRGAIEMADRIAPMLALSMRVNGNPRIVKRLMNVVRMRTSIARKRNMPLDEGIIAKLALFERCTDSEATQALHHAINAAGNGKPDLLTKMERAGADLEKLCPKEWQKYLAVLEDWVRLEPSLGGVDLRPAVYLARETVPLRIGSGTLSPAARQAVGELLATSTLASTAARDAMQRVDPSEHMGMMDALIAEIRKNSDWTRNRSDFRGAVLLARQVPATGPALSRFIKALLDRPRWMAAMIKDDDWFEE